jgi:hypothetical protein
MNLLKHFLTFIESWEESFSNPQAFNRAKDHAIASLLSSPPHTLTSIIDFKGTESQDWSADYYLYSRAKWQNANLFDLLTFFKDDYIFVAADDTSHKKTGKKIKTAFYQRDPMSPPFHPNLLYGTRFLEFTMTLPLYQRDPSVSCRSIPIRYIEAPMPKKPTKRSSEKTWVAYEEQKKKCNISIKLAKELKELRTQLDQKGYANKILVVTSDGAFCNRNCLNAEIERTVLIVRCRRDIKFCYRASEDDKKRFYDPSSFTPEEVYHDPKIPWKRKKIFRAGKFRTTWCKEVENVFWRTVTKRKPLKLIVIKRIPYRKKKGFLREAGFLLYTSPILKTSLGMQSYFDHSQIELNIKEQKFILGVGKAQVRNRTSVSRQPAFVVACYSALLLSSIKSTGDHVDPHFGPFPRWRKKIKRPSIRMLLKQLKKEILYDPSIIFRFKLSRQTVELLIKIAA